MPLGKRTRSYSKRRTIPYARRAKRARKLGRTGLAGIMRASVRPSVTQRVDQLYRMIETKEACRKSQVNVALPHNQVTVVLDSGGSTPLNIMTISGGISDPMEANAGNRVGDQISIKGIMIKGFMENALARPKVFYRIMLLRGAKGETFSRSTIFKGDSDNKMIDQINTERFTIIAQKVFTVSAANVAASGAEALNGAPLISTAGGQGTKTFKLWIPGTKFGRGGNIQYENGSATQVKFYDYRLCIVVYDWYGTPQDVNNVGRINEIYSKTYFKDA